MVSNPATRLLLEQQLVNIEQAIIGKEYLIQNASLESGLPGLSLFYYYLGLYKSENNYSQKAYEYMEQGIALLNPANFKRIYATDTIDNHISNIGKLLEFVNKSNFIELDANDYLVDLDNVLHKLMLSKISISDFDFNSGALAAGYYYINRMGHDHSVKSNLKILVEGINDKALVDSDGDYYWKSPSLYGRVYIGLSHGSAMIISFLCNVYNKGIEKELCIYVIKKAINFVLKQQRSEYNGLFPIYVGDKIEAKQFSLCYGDLGVGYALYRAAIAIGGEDITEKSLNILNNCLNRRYEDKLTLDASITYGVSGLAILFEKIFDLSSNAIFKDRAAYWYSKIPCYSIHNNEFAGFKTRLVDASPIWNINFGWGIIGIGIAIMRALKSELPPFSDLLITA